MVSQCSVELVMRCKDESNSGLYCSVSNLTVAGLLGMIALLLVGRAWRCWGLCRRRYLLNLNVHVRVPALEDGTQLPVERLHSRL